mgnify:FL=1
MRQALSGHSVNPMELKKRLGEELVGQFHSLQAARGAREEFERVYQRREVPEEVPIATFTHGLHLGDMFFEWILPGGEMPETPFGEAFLSPGEYKGDAVEHLVAWGLAATKGEAKRLLVQGAVEVDGVRVTGREMTFRDGSVIKVGKQRFLKLVERQEG